MCKLHWNLCDDVFRVFLSLTSILLGKDEISSRSQKSRDVRSEKNESSRETDKSTKAAVSDLSVDLLKASYPLDILTLNPLLGERSLSGPVESRGGHAFFGSRDWYVGWPLRNSPGHACEV